MNTHGRTTVTVSPCGQHRTGCSVCAARHRATCAKCRAARWTAQDERDAKEPERD